MSRAHSKPRIIRYILVAQLIYLHAHSRCPRQYCAVGKQSTGRFDMMSEWFPEDTVDGNERKRTT